MRSPQNEKWYCVYVKLLQGVGHRPWQTVILLCRIKKTVSRSWKKLDAVLRRERSEQLFDLPLHIPRLFATVIANSFTRFLSEQQPRYHASFQSTKVDISPPNQLIDHVGVPLIYLLRL